MQSTVLLLGLLASPAVATSLEQQPLAASSRDDIPHVALQPPPSDPSPAPGLHGRFLHITGKSFWLSARMARYR